MSENTLKELNDNWTYKYDLDQFATPEYWTILKESPYVGDCEDYSLTLLYNLSGKSMTKFWKELFTFKAKMHFCRIGGEGHAVLKYYGMYIDNIQKEWCTKQEMEAKGYVFRTFAYNPFEVFIKLHIIGKIKWPLK
jgi:predicted transglutaminase-like cysteine proteinase